MKKRSSAQCWHICFKPADIVKQLDLLRPIYSKTTNYGHFGKIDDPAHYLGTHGQGGSAAKGSALISSFKMAYQQSSRQSETQPRATLKN